MNTIVNSASNSVVVRDHIRTMDVSSTGSGADSTFGDTDGSGLKGLRKRWAMKASAQTAFSSAGLDFDANVDLRMQCEGSNFSEPQATMLKFAKTDAGTDKVPIIDKSSDDFLDSTFESLDKPTSSGYKHERDALLNTNLSVFKFPWEKGRLGKIFGPPTQIGVPVPKLSPGGRNFVQVGLSVSAGGHVDSTTMLKPKPQTTAAFVEVVRKVEDIEASDERARRRKRALEGFWQLLSVSMGSSSVGLKVSVEATIDTVQECSWRILDAIFAVKSPGTLLRRLYSLQAYQQWCMDHQNVDWIPVSERTVWDYVQWLQTTGAAPTKASSLLEALRFAWYLLGVQGADESEKSLRVKGVSMQMRAAKRPWRPADLLTFARGPQLAQSPR